MASSYTPLLGFVLPVTGELAGTWGTVWNNEGTSLLDSSIAGTTTLSTDADVTLTTTTGASNQARQAILLCSGARTALRNITAPAQSKIYVVINNTTGGFGVVIRGVGPTTGVTVAAGRTAVVVWNGADFVEVAPATATTATNLAGGAAGSLPYQTGAGVTTFRAIGTANQVLTSSGTAPQWSSSLSGLTSIVSTGNISGTSLTIHPTLSGKIGANTAWIGENSTATVAVGMYQAGSGFTNIANINFISSGSTIRSVIACTEESGGDAAYLAFSTRNAAASVGERMRITSAGNVGIGTASPGARLDITSTAAFMARFSGPVNSYVDVTDGTGTFRAQLLSNTPFLTSIGAYGLIFGTNNTERMRIDSSGNLGIGTTTPNTRLTVAASGSTPAEILRTTSTASAATYVALQAYNASSAAVTYASFGSIIEANTAGSHSGAFVINTVSAAAAVERMRIDSSGRLLVGTANTVFDNSAGIGKVQVTTDGSYNNVLFSAHENASAINGSYVTLARSRGSLLSPSTLISGDLIGRINFSAFGGTNYRPVASVFAEADDVHASGDLPSRLVFSTTSDGAATSTERMRIDSAGNVGIGTASPSSSLTVGSVAARILIQPSTNTNNAYLQLNSAAGNAYVGLDSSTDSLSAAYALNIWHSGAYPIVFGTNNTERLRIDSAGNVGIGVSSPAGKLDLISGTARLYISNQSATAFITAVNTTNTAYAPLAVNGSELILKTGDSERLRIDSAGNVGIGTSATAPKLNVALGTSYTSGASWSASVATFGQASSSGGAGGGALGISFDTTNGAALTSVNPGVGWYPIVYAGSSHIWKALDVERARITSAGDLLVAKTVSDISTVGFQVNGLGVGGFTVNYAATNEILNFNNINAGNIAYDIAFRQQAGTVGSIRVNSASVTYNTTSDYRLKDNIRPIEQALGKVAALRPVVYTWKLDGSNGEGFLAHELQEVCPQAVTGAKDEVDDQGNPRYQAIDPSKIVGLLAAAIKELKEEVDALRTQIKGVS